METISRLVLTFLINSFWQITLVAGLAALCAWLMRNAPARYRHLLWVMALGLSVLLPMWALRHSPVERRLASQRNAAASMAAGIASAGVERLHPGTMTAPNSSAERRTRSVRGRLRRLSESFSVPRPWINGLAACYLLFLLHRLVRLGWAWRRTMKIRRTGRACELPPSLAAIITGCEEGFGVGDLASKDQGSGPKTPRISVLASSQVTGPLTLGARGAAIILPDSFFQPALSAEDISAALSHEMAHVCRHDFLINLLCELLYAPVSFHPGAILIKRRIDATRELACDEMAAGRLVSASTYARALVNLARSMAGAASRPLPGPGYTLSVFDANTLEDRVMRLLNTKSGPNPRWARIIFAGALSTLVTASVLAGLAFSLNIDERRNESQVGSVPHPNLSGRWELNNAKSHLPPASPADLTQVIDQRGSQIRITTSSKSWRPDQPIAITLFAFTIPEFTASTDNTASTQKFGPGALQSKTRWEGSSLITDWKLAKDGDVAVQGRWLRHLSEDGKIQYVEITVRDPMRDAEGQASAVFENRSSSEKPGAATVNKPAAKVRPVVMVKSRGETETFDGSSGQAASVQANQSGETGNISGEVIDVSGGRVPNAVVMAINEETRKKHTTTSNEAGEFSFSSLPPGRYRLEAASIRLALYQGKVHELGPGAREHAQVVLQPSPIMESVIVTAKRNPASPANPPGAATTAPRRIRVGGNVEQAKQIYVPKPEYPESARAKGIEGTVVLEGVISTEGVPLSLHVLSSPDADLSAAAIEAVKQWRYQPTLLNGVPVEVVTTIAVRFHLAP